MSADVVPIPATCLRLQKKADEHGWTTRIQMVDGDFNGKPIHHVMLQMKRDEIRLVACWENGAFRTALKQSQFGKMNSRTLVEEITHERA